MDITKELIRAVNKMIEPKKERLQVLFSQSNKKYQLLKDTEENLYYIKRLKDNKTVLIGDREQSEDYILDGLFECKKEIEKLKFI